MSNKVMFYRKQNQKNNDRSQTGPAIMMMPPHIRATFMPNPPVAYVPPPNLLSNSRKRRVECIALEEKGKKPDENGTGEILDDSDDDEEERLFFSKKSSMSGLASYLNQFETKPPPKRNIGMTPALAKKDKIRKKAKLNADKLKPQIDKYRNHQKECAGEFNNMNCYNTLFVGRLEYSTAERKLLREFEVFGPIKDLKLIFDENKSGGKEKSKNKGYAFIEYEHEEDMKRAYRAADGMKIEGREIVVDVERGHTVPNWLPRRLGGGLGGTRLGGKKVNVTFPGRFDPSKPRVPPGPFPPQPMGHMPPPNMRGGPSPHFPPYNHPHHHNGPPMPPMRGPPGHYGNPPPPHFHDRDRDRDRGRYGSRYGGGGGGGNRRPR